MTIIFRRYCNTAVFVLAVDCFSLFGGGSVNVNPRLGWAVLSSLIMRNAQTDRAKKLLQSRNHNNTAVRIECLDVLNCKLLL